MYTKTFPSVNEIFVFYGSFRFPGCEDDFLNFSRKTELCKGMPYRMTAKNWSFGDCGWAFDSLDGRESVFKPEGNWVGWSIRWASIVGNQCCVVHSFRYGCSYKTKRGKYIYLWVFQLKLKAFTAIQYGFGIQETYLSICLLRRVANLWSTCGVNWNLSLKILNNLWESIHSLLSLKTLNILTAIILSAAGIMLEELQKPLFCANSHICFAISLQRTECMPPILLIYANAVLLSVKRWTCLTLSYARNTTLEPIRWFFVPNH